MGNKSNGFQEVWKLTYLIIVDQQQWVEMFLLHFIFWFGIRANFQYISMQKLKICNSNKPVLILHHSPNMSYC